MNVIPRTFTDKFGRVRKNRRKTYRLINTCDSNYGWVSKCANNNGDIARDLYKLEIHDFSYNGLGVIENGFDSKCLESDCKPTVLFSIHYPNSTLLGEKSGKGICLWRKHYHPDPYLHAGIFLTGHSIRRKLWESMLLAQFETLSNKGYKDIEDKLEGLDFFKKEFREINIQNKLVLRSFARRLKFQATSPFYKWRRIILSEIFALLVWNFYSNLCTVHLKRLPLVIEAVNTIAESMEDDSYYVMCEKMPSDKQLSSLNRLPVDGMPDNGKSTGRDPVNRDPVNRKPVNRKTENRKTDANELFINIMKRYYLSCIVERSSHSLV